MMNKWLMLSFFLVLLQSCFSSSNGGDHGTDLPNSLSLQVVDHNRDAVSGAQAYAWIHNQQGDTVYTCTSDANGLCKFVLPEGDSVVMISASRRFSSSMVDSLRLGFLPTPNRQAGNPLQLVLDQNVRAQLSMGLDTSLRSGFAHYLEVMPSERTDLNSPTWDQDLIRSWLDTVHTRGAQGLSYPLFYSRSVFDSMGMPRIGDSAQARIRWILDQAKQKGLFLRFVLFSNLDGQLAQAPWSDSIGGLGWASKVAYAAIVLPIAVANCDSNNVCFDNFQIEISDDGALLESKYSGANLQWFSSCFVSAVWMSIGTSFKDLNPITLKTAFPKASHEQLSFLTLDRNATLDPLIFPSEMLSLGRPTMVRWRDSRPSSTDLQKLKALNYVGWIEPL